MQDSRGQGATYGYDALNRLKTLLYADESLAFTYDDPASTKADSNALYWRSRIV